MSTASIPSADQDKAWSACRQYGWMTDQAWQALCERHTNMRPWLVASRGDPKHARLLLHALYHRLLPVVSSLLAHGASACVQPYSSTETSVFMPLYYAVSASSHAYNPALVDLLLAHGADPDEPLDAGILTSSVMAGAIDDPIALKDLLDRGWSVDMMPAAYPNQDQDVRVTPLMKAALGYFDKHTSRWKRRQSVRLLIERGANLETTNAFGQTPLLLALIHQPELVPVLLQGGANRHAQDRDGRGLHASVAQVMKEAEALGHAMRRRLARMECQDLERATASSPRHRGGGRL